MIKLVPKDAKERPIKPNIKYRKKNTIRLNTETNEMENKQRKIK